MVKEVNKFQIKSLTSDQRMFVDQIIARHGDRSHIVRHCELRKDAQDFLNKAFAPSWITRNLKVRCKNKRGRYDITALLKLPVNAFPEEKLKRKLSKKVKVEKVVLPKEPEISIHDALFGT